MCLEHYEFRKPCKRVDVCDTCLDYENKFLPALKGMLKTVRGKLCSCMPGYFTGFDANWVAEAWGKELA